MVATEREQDLARDWHELRRSVGVALRYPWTITALTATAVALSCALALGRAPSHRSDVTLRIEERGERTPVLEELAVPRGAADATDAVGELTSEAFLREVVRAPDDGRVAHPGHPAYGERLGLTTIVAEERGAGAARWVSGLLGERSPDFRLYAAIEGTGGITNPSALVSFHGESVTVAVPDDGSTVTVPYAADEPVPCGRVTVRLVAAGAPDGRTFRVTGVSVADAVAHLRARMVAAAGAGQERLVSLAVVDADPWRARDLANGLAAAYVAHDLARTRAWATDAVDYVAGELEERHAELERVGEEVAELLVEHPDAIDVERSFADLRERRAALGVRLTELAALLESLRALEERVVAGEREDASRLGAELTDPMTRQYLAALAALTQERLAVERDGASDYQVLLRQRLDAAEESARRARADRAALEAIAGELADDGYGALARIGAGTVGAVTLQDVARLGELQAELIELESEFTEEYWAIAPKRRQRDAMKASVLGQLRHRSAALTLEAENAETLAAYWEELAGARPESERARIDAAVEELWGHVEQSLAARIRGLEAEEADQRAAFDALHDRIGALAAAERRVAAPRARQASLRKVVETLLEKRELAEVALAGVTGSVALLAPAHGPGVRRSPGLGLAVAVGLLFGLLASLGACLAYEHTRGRMRVDDYEHLAVPCLAAPVREVPRPARSEGGEAPFVEFGRALRARLFRAEDERGPIRSLAVTSTRAGEGKTLANLGVAVACGLAGKRVLLVDGNMRRPALHAHFDLDPSPGLAESLDGRKHWMQCVRSTGFTRVDVLAAGEHYYDPSDMLAGPRLRALLDEVGEQYELVVFDLPHVEGATDVESVAPALDAVLLVHSDANGPARRGLEATIRRLLTADVPLVGVARAPAGRNALRWQALRRERVAA